MIKVLLLALGLTILTVAVHAVGTVYVVLPLSRVWARSGAGHRMRAAVLPLVRLIAGFLILHLVEMGVWAVAFSASNMFPDIETSLYYSFKSYTTVGYGDVAPPISWRLIGPIEGAVGILMLGWSTGFIVVAVQRLYNSDREPGENISSMK